jgi:hypothetical protein
MEPVGFRGQSGLPSTIFDHAVKHWANRIDTDPNRDWIGAIKAESPQRLSDAMHGLYNAVSYYESENRSNLDRFKSAEQMLDNDRKIISKLGNKVEHLKMIIGLVASLGCAALIIVTLCMSNQKNG